MWKYKPKITLLLAESQMSKVETYVKNPNNEKVFYNLKYKLLLK